MLQESVGLLMEKFKTEPSSEERKPSSSDGERNGEEGMGNGNDSDLLQSDLSPTSNQQNVVAVNVNSMLDNTEYRTTLSDPPTYQMLSNGRIGSPVPSVFSPQSAVTSNAPPSDITNQAGNYATLAPIQPLPPISAMTDKFNSHSQSNAPNHQSGQPSASQSTALQPPTFTIVQSGPQIAYSYDTSKIPGMPPGMVMSAPMAMAMPNGYGSQAFTPGYRYATQLTQNGMPAAAAAAAACAAAQAANIVGKGSYEVYASSVAHQLQSQQANPSQSSAGPSQTPNILIPQSIASGINGIHSNQMQLHPHQQPSNQSQGNNNSAHIESRSTKVK